MEKNRFLQTAPVYYALAIYAFLYARGYGGWSSNSIREAYILRDQDNSVDEGYCAIGKEDLFDQAIAWMIERKLIHVIPDDFGPPIFSAAENMAELVRELGKDRTLPFAKYQNLQDGQNWLWSALRSVNINYDRLGIEPSDFEEPDQEWEPLPLDRNDPKLREAIAAIDETIEQVRSDNGYAATVPEERNYVLEGLANVSKRLKEATTVSVAYLRKYALEPLNAVARRFQEAALGITAAAARQAIIEFLKQHGIKLLQQIFGP